MLEKCISVIIPVFNAEKYLKRCLDSIVYQTIGIERIELIIVDDASTDRSLQCLMKYEQQYPEHILIISLKENGGQANARNIGMEYINTPYFTFLDADDWMDLNSYEYMLKSANRFQCDLLQCSYIVHMGTQEEKPLKAVCEPIFYLLKNHNERKKFFQQWKSPGMSGASLYRTEWIKKHGFRWKKFDKYEDNYWNGVISYYINSYCAVPGYFYHYRKSHISNSFSKNDMGHFERLRVELELLDYYKEKGLFDVYYEEIRRKFLKGFYDNTLHIILCQFDYIPLEIIQEMQRVVKEIFPDYLEYCRKSDTIAEQVLTVAFNFPLNVWEDYKKAYLKWMCGEGEEDLGQFFVIMRKALGF